jgi:riboflavin kinase / FMN adenylyltransferase
MNKSALLYSSYDALPQVPEHLKKQGIVYALGMFDGVHVGHQAIFNTALQEAQNRGVPAGLFSFSTHPRASVAGFTAPDCLLSIQEKQSLAQRMGLQVQVLPPFGEFIRQLSPEAFINDMLIERLGAMHVVVGEDFRFGFQRQGTVDILKTHGTTKALGVTVLEPVVMNDLPHRVGTESVVVSSTRIREHLAKGHVEEAHLLLGRPYHVSGVSVAGFRKGRELGFPTINLKIEDVTRLLPAVGVYITALYAENRWWPAVTNIGHAPTMHPEGQFARPRIETHVLENFPFIDWVNHPVALAFMGRLRDEQRFATLEQLQHQLTQDVEQAQHWHQQQALLFQRLNLIPLEMASFL